MNIKTGNINDPIYNQEYNTENEEVCSKLSEYQNYRRCQLLNDLIISHIDNKGMYNF